MGTDYQITDHLYLCEGSRTVAFCLEMTTGMGKYSRRYSADELRTAIIKQIEVLSYISDDPEEVLKRFNCDYGQIK